MIRALEQIRRMRGGVQSPHALRRWPLLRRLTLLDFLPDPQLAYVENVHDFAGMLVSDKWTCNTYGGQTLFKREAGSGGEDS